MSKSILNLRSQNNPQALYNQVTRYVAGDLAYGRDPLEEPEVYRMLVWRSKLARDFTARTGLTLNLNWSFRKSHI
jgi:hypothetical protein